MRPKDVECSCGTPDDCFCRAEYHPCGKCHSGCVPVEHLKFTRREALAGFRKLLVVDEASMLPTERGEHLISFGVPILLVGDHGQLPPVKDEVNPWMMRPDMVLTHNFRQHESSGIVPAALLARQTGQIPVGRYGGGTMVTTMANDKAMELLTPGRFQPGPNKAVICWTNRMRTSLNRAFHGSGDLREGDRLVCLGTYDDTPQVGSDGIPNGIVQVYNGMVGTVRTIMRKRGDAVTVVIGIDAGPDVLVTLASGQLAHPDRLSPDRYPRGCQLWDYAYALTAHKAQGSEYDHVIVIDEGRMPDRKRWLYTAITRAKSACVVIGWWR